MFGFSHTKSLSIFSIFLIFLFLVFSFVSCICTDSGDDDSADDDDSVGDDDSTDDDTGDDDSTPDDDDDNDDNDTTFCNTYFEDYIPNESKWIDDIFVQVILLFKVTLTRKSIKGNRSFGFPRHPTWDQIESVKPFSFLFLKYLRVYTSDGKTPLWLPLFLKNYKGFKRDILEFVPEGNPLREFFESE